MCAKIKVVVIPEENINHFTEMLSSRGQKYWIRGFAISPVMCNREILVEYEE